ncbi:unnamed protein product, partial [Staurois parvus]
MPISDAYQCSIISVSLSVLSINAAYHPISAPYQCPLVLPICAHQCCLSMPPHQCPSVLPICAHQCCLSVQPH